MIDETSQRPDPVGAYTWLGANTPVRLEYNEAAVEMSLIGSGTGNYSGLDRFDRVSDIRWMMTATSADVARIQYGFDRMGNRTWRKDAPGSSAGYDDTYAYDGLYQVGQRRQGTLDGGTISGTPKTQEDFGYDRIGNWAEYRTRANGTLTLDQGRTHNTANEIATIDGSGALVDYDAGGNMTSTPQPADWSQKSMLTWDAWNRLISVKPGGSYAYDGMNRRIKKVTTGKVRRYYYSDQWQILEEKLNSTTATDQQYVWGVRYVDDLILRDNTSTGRLYAMQDQWNVVAICNDSGAVVERYNYSAFGSTQVLAPDYTARSISSYNWTVTYASYQFDNESGFYQVRYRYLQPSLGRWLTKDPIQEKGRINLYVYGFNNPINSVDPDGLLGIGPGYGGLPSDTDGTPDSPVQRGCACGLGLSQIAAVGPVDAATASRLANQARADAVASRLPGLEDGPADAFRHCSWSCHMAQEIGPDQAKEVSDIYEDIGKVHQAQKRWIKLIMQLAAASVHPERIVMPYVLKLLAMELFKPLQEEHRLLIFINKNEKLF